MYFEPVLSNFPSQGDGEITYEDQPFYMRYKLSCV